GGRILRHRLEQAARCVAERDHGRVSAEGHAADPQGHDRARCRRSRHYPEIERQHDRAPGQCSCRGPMMTPAEFNDETGNEAESIVINLNRVNLSIAPVNVAFNDAIERAAAATAKLSRPFLGASMVGSECLRKIQYDWWCKPMLAARTREIFARGDY